MYDPINNWLLFSATQCFESVETFINISSVLPVYLRVVLRTQEMVQEMADIRLLGTGTQQRAAGFVSSARPLSPHWLLNTVFHRIPPSSRRPRFTASLASPGSPSSSSPNLLSSSIWLPGYLDTYKLGHLLGSQARTADAILLQGPLGAGKTLFARGFIHAARRDDQLEVTSPTYLLTNTYPPPIRDPGNEQNLPPTIFHMDLWRLRDASSRPIVDLKYVFSSAIALIEWPDRLDDQQLPLDRLEVILDYAQDERDCDSNEESLEVGKLNSDSHYDPHVGTSSNDFWGFETSTNGRTARLVPHGLTWNLRVQSLLNESMQPHQSANQSNTCLIIK